MTRYAPSRHYVPAGLVALGLTAFSVWGATHWLPASVASGLFLASAVGLFYLGTRPSIEVYETKLVVGKRSVSWADIRRVDRTGWISPLIVHLTLASGSRLVLIFPGDLDSANSLLRQLRRFAREALLDGIPHRRFWGEAPEMAQERRPPSLGPLLRPDDEAEVERLFHRLKTVGHLDRKDPAEEE